METRRIDRGPRRPSPHVARRSRGYTALAASALITGALGAAIAPSSALAADDCPNAAVRAQQGVQHLPKCMAYERLTPNNKNGAQVETQYLVSDDGTEVSIYANAAITDGAVSGLPQLLLAQRAADGWELEPLTSSPLVNALRNGNANDGLLPYGSQGMRRILFQTSATFSADDVAGGVLMNSADLYIREPDGSFRWVTRPRHETYVPHQVIGSALSHVASSEDLSTIVFDANRVLDPAADPVPRNHVWVWRDGQPYEMVDWMPDGTPSTTTETGKMNAAWASPDFSTIVWQTRSGSVRRLYARVGVGTPQARTLALSESADGTVSCPSSPILFDSMTLDGRYVRFYCSAQLTPDASAAGGLYVRDTQTGAVIWDQPQVDRGPSTSDVSTSWTRPDGTYRLDDRADGLWVENLLAGTSSCVTCSILVDGQVPGVGAIGGHGTPVGGGLGLSRRNFVTPEGDAYFTSRQQLVPEDRNDALDLYMSVDGKIYLLSGGDASQDIAMGGVSLDGSTASFATASALVPDDRDAGARDIYVVRRNGGFLRATPAAACTVGCQGPAGPSGPSAPALSLAFPASGDVEDDGMDPIGVSGSRSVRGTSLKVKVRTPGAGRVTVSGSGLRSATRSLKRASSATLTVRLSERSQRLLRRKGSLQLKASVRFAPAGGERQTKRVSLTFRKKQAAKASSKKASSRAVAAASNRKAAR